MQKIFFVIETIKKNTSSAQLCCKEVSCLDAYYSERQGLMG